MLRVGDRFDDSDTGRARRANEDARFARAPLFVVADGMGGAQAGEVASRVAIETFEPGLPGDGPVAERLAALAREANRRIHELALADPSRAGMGTTLTAAHVGEGEVTLAHVGDSRAYLWRDGSLERLTRDHSLVEELVRQGKLSADEADDHPQRSIITRALGPEPVVEVDTRTHRAQAGDVYLLCSDGLTSMISEEAIAEILAERGDSLHAAGRALIDAANGAGGRDNITVILFRLEEAGRAGAEAADQPTMLGEPAPRAEGVRAAAAPPAGRGGQALATDAPPRPLRTVARRRLRPEELRRRRRRTRAGVAVRALLAVLVVAALIGIPAWIASQQVYFLGTNREGIVTVYEGFPYSLPFGLDLYSPVYVSAVPAAEIARPRREQLLNHQLRSHSDVAQLVRALEQGRIQGQ